jgi:transposase
MTVEEIISPTFQKRLKTIGRGFRNFENFRTAILFFLGKLSLYPQYSQ